MIKLLIADDHMLFRDGLTRIFGEINDIEVVAEAVNGQDALKKMRTCKWDVALLDINMPDMNGLEALKRMTDMDPSCKILVLSMCPEDEYAVRAIRSGASGYLTKDCPTATLIDAIRRLADGGNYVNPELAEKLFFKQASGSDTLLHSTCSDRELQVFKQIAAGVPLTEIANKLSLSVKTVSTYRSRVLEKMKMKNNAQLVRYAIQHDLIE